jgi:hypothetical protein
MHIELSFHHVSRDPKIDKTIDANVRKLEKLLSRFSPDLVRLHGQLEFNAPHQGPVCSLNLWLPTGKLNFRHEGDTHLTAVQDCFKHLIEQVKKHKAFVRREGAWQREIPVKKRVGDIPSAKPRAPKARARAASKAVRSRADQP